MSDHDIEGRLASRLISAEPEAAAPERAEPRTAVDRDPIDRVSCRLGDASCASAHGAALKRSATERLASVDRSLLRLQRQYGNRYVGQVLQRKGEGEPQGADMESIERSIDGARGGGSGMDHGTRSQMESSFGADFSGVRVHTDSHADELSQTLSARAFTTGSDVFFRQGEYSPGTSSGRELLAHELTHVVQQNGGAIRRKMSVSEPGDPHEVEADQMARAVIEQEHAPAADRQVIAREEEEEKPVAAKRASDALQRQPEAPKAPEEDEEKKKLHPKRDAATVARRYDDEKPG